MRHVQSNQAVDSNICVCSAATAIDFLQHCEIDGDLKYRNVLVSLFFCPSSALSSLYGIVGACTSNDVTSVLVALQQAIANRQRNTLDVELDDLAEVTGLVPCRT